MAKILPGLERPDNRSQIEAAHGAFAEITYFEVIRGRDEACGDLATRSLRVEPMQGEPKLLTEI